jgi:hypothetical protein
VAPFGGIIGLVGDEREEEEEGRAGRRGKELYDFVRDTVWAGALLVPRELIILSNVSRVIMPARVREESPRGSMANGWIRWRMWAGIIGVFPRRDGMLGWGGAGEFVVKV